MDTVAPPLAPHLHLGGCVRAGCAAGCPRAGRPTGTDGRCDCPPCAAYRVVNAAVSDLLDRAQAAVGEGESIDEDWDSTYARDLVREVALAWGEIDEDDGIAHPARLAMYVVALEAAVFEARCDYRDDPPRPHPANGWGAEAFPMAALGLF